MTAKIRFKMHAQGSERILAAADESVLGKKHVGNNRVLDLVKFASFYGEETVDAKELETHLADCTSANLVGESAVGAALKMKIAGKEQVVHIGEVPHLQLYKQAD